MYIYIYIHIYLYINSIYIHICIYINLCTVFMYMYTALFIMPVAELFLEVENRKCMYQNTHTIFRGANFCRYISSTP